VVVVADKIIPATVLEVQAAAALAAKAYRVLLELQIQAVVEVVVDTPAAPEIKKVAVLAVAVWLLLSIQTL
jgi:hypothetical protein